MGTEKIIKKYIHKYEKEGERKNKLTNNPPPPPQQQQQQNNNIFDITATNVRECESWETTL